MQGLAVAYVVHEEPGLQKLNEATRSMLSNEYYSLKLDVELRSCSVRKAGYFQPRLAQVSQTTSVAVALSHSQASEMTENLMVIRLHPARNASGHLRPAPLKTELWRESGTDGGFPTWARHLLVRQTLPGSESLAGPRSCTWIARVRRVPRREDQKSSEVPSVAS